jgi:Uncharacterised nucleotidyltransferase
VKVETALAPSAEGGAADLWRGVDALVDRMEVDAIRANGLEAYAARRLRETGRDVPADFTHRERATRAAMMIAPNVLARAREAYSGRLLVFKGPEVAALYPSSSSRSFSDIDLIADDADAAQKALLAAGFEEVPDPEDEYAGIHHLVPLRWPSLPIEIEIHDAPKWPDHLPLPPKDELLAEAVESRVAPGFEAPAPHHHALLLAAHSWGHTPLRSLRDLVDVAAMAEVADPQLTEAAARRWRFERVWRTTKSVADWLVGRAQRPAAVTLFARHLIALREATVFEGHLERWVSAFWMLPPRRALPLAARRFAYELTPAEGETWRGKVRRVAHVARHRSTPKSEYGWGSEHLQLDGERRQD